MRRRKIFSQAGRTPLCISVVCRAFAQKKVPARACAWTGRLCPWPQSAGGRLCRAKARGSAEAGSARRSVGGRRRCSPWNYARGWAF
ncbi:hypothetical protein HMPREF1546_04272 [Oscillibacter sp. KLE 1745]|nr:hypothetical protein HMPREF1546_04272 [Oscillibacter sp. KLE 1745]